MAFFKPLNTPITDWRGKSVWLVGASTGIGKACAEALHAAGARVCVSARQADKLNAFVADHPGSMALAVDVTDGPGLKAAALQVQAQQGLDMVVFCAGYYKAQRATAFDLADMDRHWQVNLHGALLLLDAILPLMLPQQRGHISMISSVAGYRGLPQGLAYAPTKAALTNLTESLYMDLQDSHIGVSVVCPGFVETPLTAHNTFEMPALISPERAASYMLQGWRAGDFEIHFPKRFSCFLKLLQMLPYRWYFPLVRRGTRL
jgi:NAD(P)-dependent dehydrogenase (short-subunit alcohol dehydrogenase family)